MASAEMHVRSLRFQNFKGLRDYRIALKRMNVLVGPNNAGKSSVLDALRILAAAVKFARRRNPTTFQVGTRRFYGYDVPVSTIPVSLVNVHSDAEYDVDALVEAVLSNSSVLRLHFIGGQRCILETESDGPVVTKAGQFAKRFPIELFAFPTLGPLEEDEQYRPDEYVERNRGTRRTARMFRNIWIRQPELFPEFKKLVETTWPGISISSPAIHGYAPAMLEMFCEEERRTREISWAGFGFQVWLQLLTHVLTAESATTLVVDEPEIYLHPDLQRRLFELLRVTGKQIVLATHSAEIVNDAEKDEVVIVNRERRAARRIADIDGLQEALFNIGSAQNIHLTKLSRGRRVLFFEGDDFKIVRRIAAQFGFAGLADGGDLTIVPIGGFAQRQRIEDAAWTFGQVLKAEIEIAALLDRDYRTAEEIDAIVDSVRGTVPRFHVLANKEIENYLLVPTAMAKAVDSRLRERPELRKRFGTAPVDTVEEMLRRCTDPLKSHVHSQLLSNRVRYTAKSGMDQATILRNAMDAIEPVWDDLATRLSVVPGKQVLAAFNSLLQTEWKASITPTQIISHLRREDVPPGLWLILTDLDAFASGIAIE